ncbi:MAG TPA: PQQ-binding-like beta-propeller repeat protein [Kofleriaceae bacterium]|nr:PQQ-binding-like beta-propeller repeat protein [Kofleriaceae bacterium]
MADPRDIPLPIVWSVQTPDDATILALAGDRLYARCGDQLVAMAAEAGTHTWIATLGKRSGDGSLVHAVGSTVVTDTRSGPQRTTELVGVRAGKVTFRSAMDCIVGGQASCALGAEVFVLGVDPKGGSVLRSIHAETGARRLDRKRSGRDLVCAGERLIILDSFAEPGAGAGLVSIDRDGADERILERTAAQEMAIADHKLLAALRTGPAPARTAQLFDLATGAVLWAHPAHGPVVALDDELAVHVESEGGALVPVARDAASGELRWRGSGPLGDDSGTFRFAGSLIAFTHGTGTTLYRRADGQLVGELLAVYALEARQRYLYLQGSERIACADASR